MVFRKWFLRCTPGITTLFLLAVVEYNLQLGRSVYCYIFYNYLEPGYTPSVVSQLLFSAYSIILHLFGVYFPVRLIVAAHRAASTIWAVHLELRADQDRASPAKKLALQPVIQVIVLPCYKENIETIQETLSVLASHRDARETYEVYLAMEERDSSARSISSQMKILYTGRFMNITVTFHPAGLPGETAGKSSNVSWAAREVIRSYSEESVQKDVLVTIMDSDSHLLDQYFQLLRARHSENRQTHSYALYVPPIIFDRNAHHVPRLVRVADLMWCGAGLSCFQTNSHGSGVIIPTSVYTLSLPLVRLADGWDAGPTAIGEDMHMMLKCYFATKGEIHIESIASPASLCNVSVSRTGLRGWFENHCARYTQGLRHMWGALDSGYAIGLWLDMDKDGSFNKRFSTVYGNERWHETLYPALLAPTRQAALLNSPSPTLNGEQIPFLSIPCLQPSQGAFEQPTDSSYYLLDAASVVPVQVLDVQPGHRVLDLCAAPGGKSVAIAQTTSVDANEFDRARFKHLEANLKYHLPAERYRVMNLDGTQTTAFERYDRVLVDAPCSSERHVIHAHSKKAAAGQIADEMVNWKPISSALAKKQLALLKTALNVVKISGKIVYATCSLSTEENDGIVEKCLQASKQEKWAVELEDNVSLDTVSEKTRYGRIILPDHPSGHHWGPIFFATMKKVDRPPP
ncbi:hypothetical protein DV736_g6198, partial [Chaetothyriales sp. CBS 134916]